MLRWTMVVALLCVPLAVSAQAGADEENAGMAAPAPADAAVQAQDSEVPPDDDAEVDTADPEHSGRIGDEQVLAQEELGEEIVRSSTDPYEDPSKTYYFLGLGYWQSFTPSFIINLFAEESVSTNNPAFALQFTYRKDGFDIITSAWWQSFYAEGPFRANGDLPPETEIIKSTLSVLFIGADFLWSTAFNDVFSIQYGLGIGLGYVFGDINRHEAYPNTDPSRAPVYNGFSRCSAPGADNPAFCDSSSVPDGEEGGHYDVNARNWANGGSTPLVWFRLAPQLGVRIKPIKQLMFRINGGFDILSGFFVGASINVGVGGS